jgi:signal peptidase I
LGKDLLEHLSVKAAWLLCACIAAIMILMIHRTGRVFFVNHTESMPRGIYVKNVQNNIELRDIIVFYNNDFKGNLIKYVAAISPSEVCFGEEGSLSVDGFAVAQINIEKYQKKAPTESKCQRLKSDEIFVLGDHPDSYDSRYFGSIKKSDVIASVKLLWAFE